MDRSAVAQRVWELAEPLVLSRGLELVDVQYRPENGRTVLRLLIDRASQGDTLGSGVTLDELARASRELGDVLDAHDAVPGRYHLECSSPGINRPLTRPEHFQRALGQRVRLRARTPISGRRQFRGMLTGVTADGVTLADVDVGTVAVSLEAIEKANIEHEFARPPGRPSTHA